MDRYEEGRKINIPTVQDVPPNVGWDAAWCTSRTPTLAWTSETAVDNVVTMEWSWAIAEIDYKDACWVTV